jgi:Tol biopolymer transport system component
LFVGVTLGLGLATFITSGPALAAGTKQVTVTRRGGDPRGHSYTGPISGDGRYMTFTSRAGDLVPGDHTVLWEDVFVRDLEGGTTVRVSVDVNGGDPNDASFHPSISADGRYVAFVSYASDLVQGDGNGTTDVFVRDLATGTTTRVSKDLQGGDPNADSWMPSISADGRYVAFSSIASDLVQGDDNSTYDVFVKDLIAQSTIRASVDTGGDDPNASSGRYGVSISADGLHVAFVSNATDLVQGDRNDYQDVFVRHLISETTVRASVDTEGGDPDSISFGGSLSDDGRYVLFSSYAADLVHGDGNEATDAFVRDLVAETTVRVSVDSMGGDPNRESYGGSMSSEGRYVSFQSWASDLIVGDGNETGDVFVRDMETGITVRVSLDVQGGDPNHLSSSSSISDDGRLLVFDSLATDLVPGPGDHRWDVFVTRV